MHDARRTLLASLFVVGAGALWGLYWVPVRALSAAGWGGALGSVAIAAIAAVVLGPVIWWRGTRWARADRVGIAATALGGSAFMLYSVGLVEARVAIVILLFYLTPVWTTVITRLWFAEPIQPLRYLVIVLGLAGLTLTLGENSFLPVPRRPGEWFALLAGLFWSVASIGMNRRRDLAAPESAFVFIVGALATALALLALAPSGLAPSTWPPGAATVGWAVAAATIWWIVPMIALVGATAYLEPARVGILLMSEVLVGVVSAALFAGEILAPIQIAGGALLVGAAVLDVMSDVWRGSANH